MRALRALSAVWALLLQNRTSPTELRSPNSTIISGINAQPKPAANILTTPTNDRRHGSFFDSPPAFSSSLTAFSVQRTKNFRSVGSSVTYDVALVPSPNMDMDSGTFTASSSGVYLMNFEFWCWRGAECRAALVVNGVAVRTGRAVAGAVMAGGQHQHVSTSTLVRLTKGDIASVILADGWLYSDARDRWTQFYGVLLHTLEDE